MYYGNACMFGLTKLRDHSYAIGDCFCHNLTNCRRTVTDSIYAVLNKMIPTEHDCILF